VCLKARCACELIFTYQLLRHNELCASVLKCGKPDNPHPHWIPLKVPHSDKILSERIDRFELFNLYKTVDVPISMSAPVVITSNVSESETETDYTLTSDSDNSLPRVIVIDSD